MEWQAELYERTVNIWLSARLQCPALEALGAGLTKKLVCTVTISEGESEAAQGVAGVFATYIIRALDVIETRTGPQSLHGMDLLLKHNGEEK